MSNYPPPGMPPTAYPQPGYPPPQPSGCGCGGCLGKFFMLLGVLVFLMILACCGAVYFGYQSVNNSIKRQPAEVQAVRDEIASVRLPPQLEPVAGGYVKVFGTALGDGAVYAASDDTSMFILARPASTDLPPNVQNPLIQILNWEEKRGRSTVVTDLNERLSDVKTKTVDRTIRGQPATFEISEGTGVKNGKKMIKVNGAFQGKTGPAVLIIMTEEDTLSRKQVDEIIQSIDAGAVEKK